MVVCWNSNDHPPAEEKNDSEDPHISARVTTVATTSAGDPHHDDNVVAILLSRMTLLEAMVQQQAIDLHACRCELTREREQQSHLREQMMVVVAKQTDRQTERQATEETQTKKWQEHFSTLQNQVLTVVTELNVIKDKCAKEAKSFKELATAVQEHSADQMEQRQEITSILAEFKELLYEKSGYYDEASEDGRVQSHIREEKALTTDKLEDAIRVLQQDWESRFADLVARIDATNMEPALEQAQKQLQDLVESKCQQTADEYQRRLGELYARVAILSHELNEAQEKTDQQMWQMQESTKTTIHDALEKSAQEQVDRSIVLNKGRVDCLEEALQDMAKEWDARIGDVTTQLEAIRQNQTIMNKKMHKKIKQFENYVTKFAEISNKTVTRIEEQTKKSQEDEVARNFFEATSNQQLEIVHESLEQVEKFVRTMKETQLHGSEKLDVAIAGIQEEHRGILKGLDSKMDLFRGRVEYLASKIPNQEEDIEVLKVDVPKQIESLTSDYQSLVTRFEHLLNAVEQYNQEQSSKQEATQTSLDELRVQLDAEGSNNSERLFQESQVESRFIPSMPQIDIKRRLDDSCYPQLVVRPEVKQMLKQHGIVNI